MSHQLQTDKERRFFRLVTTLTHIQDLAYANEDRRTSQNILAMHNLTYIFFLDYKKVSNNECVRLDYCSKNTCEARRVGGEWTKSNACNIQLL